MRIGSRGKGRAEKGGKTHRPHAAAAETLRYVCVGCTGTEMAGVIIAFVTSSAWMRESILRSHRRNH